MAYFSESETGLLFSERRQPMIGGMRVHESKRSSPGVMSPRYDRRRGGVIAGVRACTERFCSRAADPAPGAPATRSRSRPWNGSTGSTTGQSTSTAETRLPSSSRPPTLNTTRTDKPPAPQSKQSPDTRGNSALRLSGPPARHEAPVWCPRRRRWRQQRYRIVRPCPSSWWGEPSREGSARFHP